MTLSLRKLGTTPIKLDRALYIGRTLIVSKGQQTQKLHIADNKYDFVIDWTPNEKEVSLEEDLPPITPVKQKTLKINPLGERWQYLSEFY